MLSKTFQAIHLAEVGPEFCQLFSPKLTHYRDWFLMEGEQRRPSLAVALRALQTYMPQLMPVYNDLVENFGRDDLNDRMLTLYDPMSYVRGCSLLRWHGETDVLIRNYDYPPHLCDGILLRSQWQGVDVIGMTDCIWGLLDGINQYGLSVAFSFGGRPVRGKGFAVSLIVRYLLQTCRSVEECMPHLKRIPVNMAYNLILMDADGNSCTVAIGPDIEPTVTQQPFAANRQTWLEEEKVEWTSQEIESLEDSWQRESALAQLSESQLMGLNPGMLEQQPAHQVVHNFMLPPLFRHFDFAGRWGTAYTACYYPQERRCSYHWQELHWEQSFDHFIEQQTERHYYRATV